ncbi:MAG: hypothetical protein R2909_00770 [Gemmatimonadales bacterium]
MMQLTWKRLSLIGLLALGTACAPDSDTVLDAPSQNPSEGLAAQHAANLAAIEALRAESEASYDGLMSAWQARTSGARPMLSSSSDGTMYVACQPLPFDGEAQIVGAAGGTFEFGPHRLTVPAGAVTGPISIAVIVTTSLKTEVVLLPHGTQFATPVSLDLAYGHCEDAPTHRVAYVDAQDNVIEWTTSFDHPDLLRITAELSHFSTYAIAY